jgi:hypothetical protein
MSPDELRELGEDIKTNGLKLPIAITGDGKLLDGRNRLDAMETVGVEFKFGRTTNDGPIHIDIGTDGLSWPEIVKTDPYAYVISANIHRRHLTVEQRQHLLITLIARAPEKSDRQIGGEIGVDHKTIASARAKGETTGEISPVEKRVGKDGKSRRPPARKPRKTKQAKEADPPPQMGRPEPPPRDDIGPDSANEAERLRVYVEKLEAEKRCLELKVAGLEREIEELREARDKRLATANTAPVATAPPDESPEGYWQRSLTGLADEVIVRTTCHWPDGWKKFGVPPPLLEHASRAMTTWCDLVKQLSTQPIPPPADDGLDIPDWLRRDKRTEKATS